MAARAVEVLGFFTLGDDCRRNVVGYKVEEWVHAHCGAAGHVCGTIS